MGRTYNQSCVLAYTLDLLGERWTFLIVRQLLLGPQRFAEILAGLEGIGPNLLTKRLRDLEDARLVERAAGAGKAQRYQLTAEGEGLRSVLGNLVRWGFAYLVSDPDQSLLRYFSGEDGKGLTADAIALAMEAYAKRRAFGDTEFICRVQIEDTVFTLFHVNQKLLTRRGDEAPANAQVASDRQTLRAILTGALPVEEAERTGQLSLEAPPEVAEALRKGIFAPARL